MILIVSLLVIGNKMKWDAVPVKQTCQYGRAQQLYQSVKLRLTMIIKPAVNWSKSFIFCFIMRKDIWGLHAALNAMIAGSC